MGDRLGDGLKSLNAASVAELRQIGLWIGIQLKPEAGKARAYCEALQQEGMLCKETHEHTIRFAPPLVITREELDWAFERVATVFRELDG
jgi:ornithine--oxo-acid transaminase